MGSPSFSDKWHIDQLCSSFIIDALGFILRKSPLKNIYLCTIISCKHSSVNGHLGCFHVLVIVKSVATNIGVHATLSVMFSMLPVRSLPSHPSLIWKAIPISSLTKIHNWSDACGFWEKPRANGYVKVLHDYTRLSHAFELRVYYVAWGWMKVGRYTLFRTWNTMVHIHIYRPHCEASCAAHSLAFDDCSGHRRLRS